MNQQFMQNHTQGSSPKKYRLIRGGACALVLIMLGGALLTGCGSQDEVQMQDGYDPTFVTEPENTPAPEPTPTLEPLSNSEPRDTVDLAEFGGMPKIGDKCGRVSIEGTEVDCDIYYGDYRNKKEIREKGAGIFPNGQLPGMGGATLMEGTSLDEAYFRDLESVEIGDDVKVVTDCGEFHYRVNDIRIIEIEGYSMGRLENNPPDTLLMYTRYPFEQPGETTSRYLVTCEFVSGPAVVYEEAKND